MSSRGRIVSIISLVATALCTSAYFASVSYGLLPRSPFSNGNKAAEKDQLKLVNVPLADASFVLETPSDEQVAELRRSFNDAAGRPRFVAILSYTWGPWVKASGAVRTAILEKHPELDIAVFILWLNMIPTDAAAAAEPTPVYDDNRVTEFHMPNGIGHLFGESLGYEELLAWDVYMFYDPESVWESNPPPSPSEWAHQLGGDWDDSGRFKAGSELEEMLEQTAARLSLEQLN